MAIRPAKAPDQVANFTQYQNTSRELASGLIAGKATGDRVLFGEVPPTIGDNLSCFFFWGGDFKPAGIIVVVDLTSGPLLRERETDRQSFRHRSRK